MKNLKALVAEPTAPAAPEATASSDGKRPRPDREGLRLIAAHVDADTFRTFKILSAEQGGTTQEMVAEALELLFRKYHKPVAGKLAELARQRG